MQEADTFDALIVGAGPTGLAAALALARAGLRTALAGSGTVARRTGSTRTAALFRPAISLLSNLNVWPSLAGRCAPLVGIRIVDTMGFALRAPEVVFRSSEIDWTEFGYNVPDDLLVEALTDAVGAAGVELLPGGAVTDLRVEAAGCSALLENNDRVSAGLVVAADGRDSLCRSAAGIAARQWSYDQCAVTTQFAHTRAHSQISTELHGSGGPCTTVPLPGRKSSLVWVERTVAADRLTGLDDTGFIAALSDKLGGLLGELSAPAPRRSFPLYGLAAERLAASRVVLVGEAAHVLPPIGAQGLNLGLLDVAVLASCAADAVASRSEIGGATMIERYNNARRTDVEHRIRAVDLLNRSLTSNFAPVTLARGAGLHALAALPALRRRAILAGLLPQGPLPRLMQLDDPISV